MDMRPLSVRLREKIPEGEWERASIEMGQPKNAVSRWIDLTVLPGPDKYTAIATYLGITEFEVGGAIALDAKARRQARRSQ